MAEAVSAAAEEEEEKGEGGFLLIKNGVEHRRVAGAAGADDSPAAPAAGGEGGGQAFFGTTVPRRRTKLCLTTAREACAAAAALLSGLCCSSRRRTSRGGGGDAALADAAGVTAGAGSCPLPRSSSLALPKTAAAADGVGPGVCSPCATLPARGAGVAGAGEATAPPRLLWWGTATAVPFAVANSGASPKTPPLPSRCSCQEKVVSITCTPAIPAGDRKGAGTTNAKPIP